MPVIIAMLIGALAEVAGSLVGRILLALGLQMTVYAGLDVIFDEITSYALSNLTGFSGVTAQIISLFRVDEVIAVLSGAITASMTVQGIKSGTLTKLVHK